MNLNRRSPLFIGVIFDGVLAGFRCDAVEPGADCGECGEIEVALVREVCVGIERDVDDGIAPAAMAFLRKNVSASRNPCPRGSVCASILDLRKAWQEHNDSLE